MNQYPLQRSIHILQQYFFQNLCRAGHHSAARPARIIFLRPLLRPGALLSFQYSQQFPTDDRSVFFLEPVAHLPDDGIYSFLSFFILRIGISILQPRQQCHGRNCAAYLAHPPDAASHGACQLQGRFPVHPEQIRIGGKNRLGTAETGFKSLYRFFNSAFHEPPPYWFLPQHFLYFLPLPHGHGSFLPTFFSLTIVPDFFCFR